MRIVRLPVAKRPEQESESELLAIVLREIEEVAETLSEDPFIDDDEEPCGACGHRLDSASRLETLAAKIKCRVVVS